MSEYGAEAWKLHNTVLQQMYESAQKQLVELRSELLAIPIIPIIFFMEILSACCKLNLVLPLIYAERRFRKLTGSAKQNSHKLEKRYETWRKGKL